jgi:sporulation protein YqfC
MALATRKALGRGLRPTFPAIEWLEEAAGALPRLMLAGGRRAMIENHTGILEFSPSCVRLMTRQGVLMIRGEALLLTQIRPDALTVRGEIRSIELPGGPDHLGGPDHSGGPDHPGGPDDSAGRSGRAAP